MGSARPGDRLAMTALPPRAAGWLMRVLLPRQLRDEALEDLVELYAVRVARAGKRAADRAYWRQLPGVVFWLRVAPIGGP
ncbi:MAG: permease prefix domain 2-containing transporter, partial [Longimicrobiales bacterium]